MAELLKKFQEEHVSMKEDHVLHKTIVHGDQLTEERERNVQSLERLKLIGLRGLSAHFQNST